MKKAKDILALKRPELGRDAWMRQEESLYGASWLQDAMYDEDSNSHLAAESNIQI